MTGVPRSLPWYAEGLRFRCTRCGNCCRGEGNVWIADAEVGPLASFVGMSAADLRAACTQPAPHAKTGARLERQGRPGQPEDPMEEGTGEEAPALLLRQRANGDCVFWRADRGCTVYPVRPRQCRTYPFWHANVHTPEAWRAESAVCPGIGAGGDDALHAAATVEAAASNDGIPAHRTRLRAMR